MLSPSNLMHLYVSAVYMKVTAPSTIIRSCILYIRQLHSLLLLAPYNHICTLMASVTSKPSYKVLLHSLSLSWLQATLWPAAFHACSASADELKLTTLVCLSTLLHNFFLYVHQSKGSLGPVAPLKSGLAASQHKHSLPIIETVLLSLSLSTA